MKNIQEVLRQKEYELEQLQREVDAIRLVVRLLTDEGESAAARNEVAVVPVTAGTPLAAVARVQRANGRILDPAIRQFP